MAAITVIGAGVAGLWQALTLAREGHAVRLLEKSPAPFDEAASRFAGAMLAPFCEGEAAESWITELGAQSIGMWRDLYPDTAVNGSLVVALPRDVAELPRFARMTGNHQRIGGDEIAALEPALAGRYAQALFYPGEGHVEPAPAMEGLLRALRGAGAEVVFGAPWEPDGEADRAADFIVDCRGMAAQPELPELRGVRGEMLLVETAELTLSRPVRLLHPRFPIYVVPWSANRFMIGATVIESADERAVTLRSALELLGAAYALHPAFGEARIVSFGAGVRPSFPDNAPRIILKGRHICVNGLYRHGFLLAPVLAGLVARYIRDGSTRQDVFVEDYGERRASGRRGAHAG
jgi:glycine oxidase